MVAEASDPPVTCVSCFIPVEKTCANENLCAIGETCEYRGGDCQTCPVATCVADSGDDATSTSATPSISSPTTSDDGTSADTTSSAQSEQNGVEITCDEGQYLDGNDCKDINTVTNDDSPPIPQNASSLPKRVARFNFNKVGRQVCRAQPWLQQEGVFECSARTYIPVEYGDFKSDQISVVHQNRTGRFKYAMNFHESGDVITTLKIQPGSSFIFKLKVEVLEECEQTAQSISIKYGEVIGAIPVKSGFSKSRIFSLGAETNGNLQDVTFNGKGSCAIVYIIKVSNVTPYSTDDDCISSVCQGRKASARFCKKKVCRGKLYFDENECKSCGFGLELNQSRDGCVAIICVSGLELNLDGDGCIKSSSSTRTESSSSTGEVPSASTGTESSSATGTESSSSTGEVPSASSAGTDSSSSIGTELSSSTGGESLIESGSESTSSPGAESSTTGKSSNRSSKKKSSKRSSTSKKSSNSSKKSPTSKNSSSSSKKSSTSRKSRTSKNSSSSSKKWTKMGKK
jgi:hypothetical protein